MEGDADLGAATLDALFGEVPFGVTLLDAEGRFLRVNSTFAAANGPSPDRHVGRLLEDVLGEGAVAVRALVDDVVATGRALPPADVAVVDAAGRRLGRYLRRRLLRTTEAVPGARRRERKLGPGSRSGVVPVAKAEVPQQASGRAAVAAAHGDDVVEEGGRGTEGRRARPVTTRSAASPRNLHRRPFATNAASGVRAGQSWGRRKARGQDGAGETFRFNV